MSQLKLLRAISHELRKAMPKKSIRNNESMNYIMSQYRTHQITDKRVCLEEHELKFIGQTYLTYLTSTRNYRIIYDKYYGRGERSIEDAAKTVGLALPVCFNNDKEIDK